MNTKVYPADAELWQHATNRASVFFSFREGTGGRGCFGAVNTYVFGTCSNKHNCLKRIATSDTISPQINYALLLAKSQSE
jgi:hypothetical protein